MTTSSTNTINWSKVVKSVAIPLLSALNAWVLREAGVFHANEDVEPLLLAASGALLAFKGWLASVGTKKGSLAITPPPANDEGM